MSFYKKKFQPFFLDKADEARLSVVLREGVSDIVFLDGIRWASEDPPAKRRIEDCLSDVIALWSPSAVSSLPCKEISSGVFMGPSSGVVIQMMRGAESGGILVSGQMGTAVEESNQAMMFFADQVFSCLRRSSRASLECVKYPDSVVVKKNIREYVTGYSAAERSRVDGLLLKHCAADIYYRPFAVVGERDSAQ